MQLHSNTLLLAEVLLALLFHASIADICPNEGKQCDKFAPCCNSTGHCDTNPLLCFIADGCNPNGSYTPQTCLSEVPKCKSFREDFDRVDAVPSMDTYRGNPDYQHFVDEYGGSSIENGFLVLRAKYDSTLRMVPIVRIQSTRWFQYGKVTARIRTGLTAGLVNTFIYKSSADRADVGDEIDFEWIDKYLNATQTNWFIDGVQDYSRGKNSYFSGSTSNSEFHTYTIDWQPTYTAWLIDGNVIRNETAQQNGKLPKELGRLFFSIWDTCGSEQGTIDWAGGPSPWCAPGSSLATTYPDEYKMQIDWVEMKCYTEDKMPIHAYIPDTPQAVESVKSAAGWKVVPFSMVSSSMPFFTLLAVAAGVVLARRLV